MKIYQRITDERSIEPSLIYLITSHHPPCQLNRTWKLNLFGHRFFICTRCLGQYAAFIVTAVIGVIEGLPVMDTWIISMIALLTVIPGVIDWFTQTMGWRESSNSIRVLTGWLFGTALGVLVASLFTGRFDVLLVFVLVFLLVGVSALVLLRANNRFGVYLKPYEDFLNA